MNRFSKGMFTWLVLRLHLGLPNERLLSDIDTVDNLLGGLSYPSYPSLSEYLSMAFKDSFRMFVSTFSSILGAVILISIVLPWFLIAVFVFFIAYFYAAVFYRASARELMVCFPSYTFNRRAYLMCMFTSVLVNIFLQRMAEVHLFLDAVLMSSLYSHFSESLSGLATIRAHGEVERFCEDNEKRVDTENRAYWLTVTNQV
jgi:ABC-type multidrug transport system fused ATPase/permease subunit